MNGIRRITRQATIAFDFIEWLGKGGIWQIFNLDFFFSYSDTKANLIYNAQYSLVIPQITSVKIRDQSWMTQREQDTKDFIF